MPILNPELEGVIRNYENYRRVYRVQIDTFGKITIGEGMSPSNRKALAPGRSCVCFEGDLVATSPSER